MRWKCVPERKERSADEMAERQDRLGRVSGCGLRRESLEAVDKLAGMGPGREEDRHQEPGVETEAAGEG